MQKLKKLRRPLVPLPLTVAAAGLLLSACPTGPGGDGPDAGPPAPEGNCLIDGTSYRADEEASRLLIFVKKEAAAGCGPFHNHVVEAEVYGLDCDVSTDDLAGSSITVTVPVEGLNPDKPENRALFPELDDETVTENDRPFIKNSVRDMTEDSGGTLVFTASSLSGLEGEGLTLTLGSKINGDNSEAEMTFNGARDGEAFVISEGLATVDGDAHGIPSGFGSSCVRSDMDVHLELKLVPGEAVEPDIDAGPAFEETFFPYEGDCHEDVGWQEARQVLVRRCAGCHDASTDFALVEYEDWRVDSVGYPGQPRFETAAELIALPEDESRHMPPVEDASALPEDELALITTWFDAGAPEERCEPLEHPPFAKTEREVECGTVGFGSDPLSDPADADSLVDNIFLFNGCADCHIPGAATVPAIDPFDYNTGLADAEHPFYQAESGPLTLWEASIERIRDGTMPPDRVYTEWIPVVGDTKEEDLALLDAWLAAGFPQNVCP